MRVFYQLNQETQRDRFINSGIKPHHTSADRGRGEKNCASAQLNFDPKHPNQYVVVLPDSDLPRYLRELLGCIPDCDLIIPDQDHELSEEELLCAVRDELIQANREQEEIRIRNEEEEHERAWYKFGVAVSARRDQELREIHERHFDYHYFIKQWEKCVITAEKHQWITDHGSEYLRRAVVQHGYPCHRTYVIERIQHTYPDVAWVFDWDDNLEYNTRKCPSEEALDLQERFPDGVIGWGKFGECDENCYPECDSPEHKNHEIFCIRNPLELGVDVFVSV